MFSISIVQQLVINTMLFIGGIFGLFLNQENLVKILMCFELILLSVNLNFITFSLYLDDFLGQLFSLFILTVAAAESAIGLAILILYYRIRGSVSIKIAMGIKG